MSSEPATEARPRDISDHPRSRRVALYSALLVHLLLSSCTFIVAKFALAEMPVPRVALLRFAIASAVLGLIWLVRGGRVSHIPREDWGRLAWLGFLAVPCNQGFFLGGLSLSSPAHAALFYSTTPVFVLLLSLQRGDEKMSAPRVLGIAAAMVGVVLVLLDRGLRLDRAYLGGDAMLLMAVISWALYSVAARELMSRHSAVDVTALSLIMGTLMTVPAAPFVFRDFHPMAYTAGVWGSVLFLALGTSVIAYFLWMWCLSHAEASQVAVFTNFQPVVTTALAVYLLHESYAPHFFLGGALVLAGVIAAQRSRG
jgi:drug/metabolite transporter (DMT)-like permease